MKRLGMAMTGYIGTHEQAVLRSGGSSPTSPEDPQVGAGTAWRTIHRYGRVEILAEPAGREAVPAPEALDPAHPPPDLSETERLGLAALRLRQSEEYRATKSARPRDGEDWDMPGCTAVAPRPNDARTAMGGEPLSSYLEGRVGVGIIIVEGPGSELKFSDEERTKILAEVQEGLGWLARIAPSGDISYSADIQSVTLDVQPDPLARDLEARWRDPAMAAIGLGGVHDYASSVRRWFKARWAYCAFFTKYPLWNFAYAYLGGPHLVMDYALDNWGPDNMDRVFAHETGHIFNCPDEYAKSNCTCGGRWGRFDAPNGNCERCAPGHGVPCLMKKNTPSLCDCTKSHIGWSVETPLYARHSGRVLDVNAASRNNGASVVQWDWYSGDNQRWRLDTMGDGYVRATAKHSDKVLDVKNDSGDNDAAVIQWSWHGGDNQRWRLDPTPEGSFRLVAKHSGKVLDIQGGSKDNGASAVQQDWRNDDSQRWRIEGSGR
ncbi:RICIN domain-containing protein [Streptomyces pini]|uniref:Ricin-type beta-trefoil lectin domain-containing protein n=1 Tax=Streptomyces pini TaxID=1520580 RepID=A0A1I3XZ07_9ACTN|nr:RICIN domain-containing protein [Streptomyces pini]SFK24770.1 Ricin-type beta-trefoil lectin domain-containing protein [Streptomyces pini]